MADAWPITLAGILMDGEPDADGVRWHAFADLDGWDSAPVRLDSIERTGRHGSVGSTPLWAARTLVVPGDAECPDMATAFRVREAVTARLSCLGGGTLIVHESVAKGLEVAIGGQPRSSWPIDAPPYRVTWQVTLTADDPFKRVLTPTVTIVPAASTVPVASLGTAEADLLITVTTAGTVVLTAGGVTLTTGILPVGAAIDTASCEVLSAAGVDLFTAVVPGSQWPSLPKGGGPLVQAGTAGLSVTHYDTYA